MTGDSSAASKELNSSPRLPPPTPALPLGALSGPHSLHLELCFDTRVQRTAVASLGMPIFADLHLATSDGGLLHGIAPARVLAMLEALDELETMRTLPDGRPCSRQQRDMLSSSFRAHWGLTPEQYTCLCRLLDEGALRNMRSTRESAVPPTPLGIPPAYVTKCFAAHINSCCGSTMRVRKIQATLYGRDRCVSVWHLVKDCRNCKTVYYCDKRVLRGEINLHPPQLGPDEDDPLDPGNPLNNQGCRWHEYYAWENGRCPMYVFSKSGRTVIEASFLTDCVVTQCKTRLVLILLLFVDCLYMFCSCAASYK